MPRLVVGVFVAHDEQDEQDIPDSLAMLAENDSYSLMKVEVRDLTPEDLVAAVDAGILEPVYSPPFSPYSYNGDYPDGEEPTCDLCGRAQDDHAGNDDPWTATDWNGETGNHASCEEREARVPGATAEPSAFYPTR